MDEILSKIDFGSKCDLFYLPSKQGYIECKYTDLYCQYNFHYLYIKTIIKLCIVDFELEVVVRTKL